MSHFQLLLLLQFTTPLVSVVSIYYFIVRVMATEASVEYRRHRFPIVQRYSHIQLNNSSHYYYFSPPSSLVLINKLIMANRCPVCNGWMNTTAGGVHNCPGKPKAVETMLDTADIDGHGPQLVKVSENAAL
ncbi:hypothetical protein FPOAC2_07516 [Fusarium poae]